MVGKNCANRCYCACFQAAIAALLRAGIHAASQRERWPHTFVQGEFTGRLINRRHLYPTELRSVLSDLQSLRHGADYDADPVTETEAARAVRRARAFVEAIRQRGGETE